MRLTKHYDTSWSTVTSMIIGDDLETQASKITASVCCPSFRNLSTLQYTVKFAA